MRRNYQGTSRNVESFVPQEIAITSPSHNSSSSSSRNSSNNSNSRRSPTSFLGNYTAAASAGAPMRGEHDRRFGVSANNLQSFPRRDNRMPGGTTTSTSTNSNTSKNRQEPKNFLQEAKMKLRRSPSPPRNRFKNSSSNGGAVASNSTSPNENLVKPSLHNLMQTKQQKQHGSSHSVSSFPSKQETPTRNVVSSTSSSNFRSMTKSWGSKSNLNHGNYAGGTMSNSHSSSTSLGNTAPSWKKNVISKEEEKNLNAPVSPVQKKSIKNSAFHAFHSNAASNTTAAKAVPKYTPVTKTTPKKKASSKKQKEVVEHTNTGDQSNVWVKHSLVYSILNPKPTYGSQSSTVSEPAPMTPQRKPSFNRSYSTTGNATPSTPSFVPLNSTAKKLFKKGNDDASLNSGNGNEQQTMTAKWGWVKALLLNHDDFTKSSTNASTTSSRTSASVEDTSIPAWKRKLKSTSAPPKPDFDLPADCVKSTSSISSSSTTSKTPSMVSLKIIDQESDYYGKTVDIPIEKLQSGNSTNIFGEELVMANAWPNFIALPEAIAPKQDVKTPVSKWSTFKNSSKNFEEEKKEETQDDSNIPSDLTNLTHLHEPAVVYCLRSRYAMNEIYTSTGPILLALNPFKEVRGVYSDELMKQYCDRGQGVASANRKKSLEKLPPHVYAVADNAYRAMMRALDDHRGDVNGDLSGIVDQSILVSGESGAGKTVTTKIIMKYLAALSKRSGAKKNEKKKPLKSIWTGVPQNFASPSDDGTNVASPNTIRGRNIEQQVLESNPILESFGNARTIRNDNSSRFGKFIELKFTSTGRLVGASIDSYLLEKVRLIKQADGERNYHIFYELLAGANGSERKELLLGRLNPPDFAMTASASDTYKRRDNVRDDSTFESLRKAMVTMGFDMSQQSDILQIVSALLHLSNITFDEDSSGCKLNGRNFSLEPALKLLGVSDKALEQALCCVNIEAGGERVVKRLFHNQSIKAKEALIKSTYGALFSYLVKRINNCINGGISESEDGNEGKKLQPAAFIGVLDIFGFESFEKNSFEQLCINYCNESLQQQFNRFVFKLEQAEYEREGIQWNFISFPDNQNVLDFIDKKRSGILSILDEQSFLTQCTDSSFAQLVYQKCGGGRSGQTNPFSASSRQMANGKFSIHHYAGPVEYDTNGFLEKNKDELPKEIDDLLHSSNNEFLRSLTNEMSNAESEEDKPSFSKSSLKRITVGGQFSAQLQLLRKRIDATSPHYIRCLKPNDKLEPDNFDSAIIADQLRCAGILEAVRVSRVGYPQRYLHSRFVQRYQCLAMKELQLRRKDASSTFSTPVGFGFNGGFVPKNHTRSHRSMNSSPKRGKSYQQREEKRLSSDQECKILVSCIARELMADKQDDNEDIHNSKPTKWSSPSKSSRYAPMISKKKHELDLLAIGIQMGKTKVFLRQHAFEALEVLRRKIQNEAATVLNSVFRMYMKRRRYIVIRNEYRARVAQRSRMIAEGGVVGSHEEFYLDAVNASFESAKQFNFKAGDEKISFHREEEYRRCENFKWIMVDNRWMKNDEDEDGSDDVGIKN